MQASYLISDLHLEAVDDPVFDRFRRFLAAIRVDAARLFLLGDLFEAWVGDDDDSALARAVAEELALLAASGVELAFLHGNRDFLLGADYATRCRMRLLPETSAIELHGRSCLLLHGDTLCTGDVGYQAVRRQIRDPGWQAAFLARDLAGRRAFAAEARAESGRHTAAMAESIMDVDAEAVAAAFAASGADWLIHGHTHRPDVHEEGAQRRRIVLGDWPRQASWLRIDDAGAELHFEGRCGRIA